MGAFILEVIFNEQHRQSYQLLTMKHLTPTTEDWCLRLQNTSTWLATWWQELVNRNDF